jgi:hypothetical protein
VKLKFALIVTIFLCAAQVGNAQGRKLYPIDDAAKDPTFFVFRARLFRAIQEKDARFIYSILHEQIENDFGGGVGIPSFKSTWHLERVNSPFWSEFRQVLSLGGKFDEKDHSFSAPYLFNSFPQDADAFQNGAIIEDGVRVRKQPTTQSEVLRTLSFDIVAVPDWQVKRGSNEKREWVKVKLEDGQTGFVAAEFIRSPIDYRAIFEKKNGKWLMTAFIAGD